MLPRRNTVACTRPAFPRPRAGEWQSFLCEKRLSTQASLGRTVESR